MFIGVNQIKKNISARIEDTIGKLHCGVLTVRFKYPGHRFSSAIYD